VVTLAKGGRQKQTGKREKGSETPDSGKKSSLAGMVYPSLAGIFLIGLILRLYEISRKPLWLDEASTYYLTTQPDLMSVISAASADHHAPLHFITIWCVRLFGSSEFFLRAPSAIAGALTVLVIFFIAKEIWNEHAGLIAAALLAVSPYHILYSQEARMYGMAVLFVSLAVYMFLRSARTGRLSDWLLFGGTCALAFYTHFYTAFAIVALVAGYFVLRFRTFYPKTAAAGGDESRRLTIPPDFRNFLAGMIFSFVLVIPVLASFFNQSGYFIGGTFNWGLSMGDIPLQTFLLFSSGGASGIAVPLALLIVLLAFTGIAMLWFSKKEMAVALAAIFFIPMFISMYLSRFIPFNVRYHLYLIVVFFALAAIPLEWLSKKLPARYGTVVIMGLIVLIFAVPLTSYYTEAYQDWRGSAATLTALTNNGDAVVPLPWNNYLPLSYYYNNETDGTHYRNFALTDTGFQQLDSEKGNVFFVVTIGDLSAKGEPAYSTSVAYLDNRTRILSGKNIYDVLILEKVS
jgi:uncharacterized membrane protein